MKMKHVTLIAMMAMFSDFVSAGESAAPVFDMIAENVIIIKEIRAKYNPSKSKDCTPLDTCEVISTSHHVAKIYLVEPTNDNPGKFVVNTGDLTNQRITIYDDNMNGVPNRIDDASYDITQMEGVFVLHGTLLDIRQHMSNTVHTKD